MSRLFQRLASEARGTNGACIRPAAAMRAHVPITMAPGEPGSVQNAEPARERWAYTAGTGFSESRSTPDPGRAPETVPAAPAFIVDPERGPHTASRAAVPPHDRAASAPPVPFLLREVVVAAPANAAVPMRPVMTGETRTEPNREPSEVHVHIGRIEVTAVPATPPAAAPKRRERPARTGVTLSDYLAKRRSP